MRKIANSEIPLSTVRTPTPKEKVAHTEIPRQPNWDQFVDQGIQLVTGQGSQEAKIDANTFAIQENAKALARIEFLLKDKNKDKIISEDEEKLYDQETRIAIHGMNDAKKTTRNTQIYSLLARLVDIGLFLFWGFRLGSQ